MAPIYGLLVELSVGIHESATKEGPFTNTTYPYYEIETGSCCHCSTSSTNICHSNLPHSNLRLGVSVGVVDYGIEGLVKPLSQYNIDELPINTSALQCCNCSI